jgi:cyanate lyase
MKDLFVSYEQAAQLKELGFNEPSLRVGNPNGHTLWKFMDVLDMEGVDIGDIIKEKFDDRFVELPLKVQVFKWFREKGFIICLDSHSVTEHEFYIKWSEDKSMLSNLYEKYEHMEDDCIDKLIEIIKNK